MTMIRVILEAEDVEAVREQMLAFLGMKQAVAQGFVEPVAEPEAPKAKKTKKAAPAAPVAEPDAIEEEEPEPVFEAEEQEEDIVTPEAEKAVMLLKLKEQQLSRLRDLFNAGKGPLVRQLLAKYGEGAKVFPEVDAKHFPAIKVELDRELNA